jgi:MFS family permease
VAAPAGRVAQRIGHGKVVAVGALLLSSGNLFLSSQLTTEVHYWSLYLPTMIYTGLGVGMCISTISSSATAFLPQPKFAMGSALNNTARQVGAALGVALVSAMLVAATKTSDPLQGFHNSWHLTAGIIFASGTYGNLDVWIFLKLVQARADTLGKLPEPTFLSASLSAP